MKIKLPELRALKAIRLGLRLAAAFPAPTFLLFPETKYESGTHYSIPNKIALPNSNPRYRRFPV